MSGPAGLSVSGLIVRFGGLLAVDDVSFEVPAGRLTGLIGPNGAGKTTIFNACTGLVPADQGQVSLNGIDVSGFSPSSRARAGLGRTFQKMELFDRLTVYENVALGRDARLAGRGLMSAIRRPRAEIADVRGFAEEAISRCGLEELRNRRVGPLPSGQRRLVELARAMAGNFDVLLLDEPSSGLDPSETTSFASILKSLAQERGTAILLVEHDMALVTSVCEYIYVLDFGRLLEHGTVSDILSSEKVRAAYLGSEAA